MGDIGLVICTITFLKLASCLTHWRGPRGKVLSDLRTRPLTWYPHGADCPHQHPRFFLNYTETITNSRSSSAKLAKHRGNRMKHKCCQRSLCASHFHAELTWEKHNEPFMQFKIMHSPWRYEIVEFNYKGNWYWYGSIVVRLVSIAIEVFNDTALLCFCR